MNISELRKTSVDELLKELTELRREQFNMRIQKGTGQTVRPHLFKEVKQKIARIKMVLTEKGKGA